MKRFTYIFLLIFVCATPVLSQAQYSLTGIVKDQKKNEPLPYAQIALLQVMDSTIVAGSTTDINGHFSLKAAPGNYFLRVYFLGYKNKIVRNISMTSDTHLGVISVEPDMRQLNEVVIVEEIERTPIKVGVEGLEIRPEHMISNTGGTALDILRGTPSVTVSDDGTVSLRGTSGTNVLIDGRNSAMATDLEQIPASEIESIKIINNPNAKYDAQAAGGIINIQLKKGKGTGTKAAVEVTAGTGNRYNGNARISRHNENLQLHGGYSIRSWPRTGCSETKRLIFETNELMTQNSTRENQDLENTITLGASLYKGKNKFTYEGSANMENEDGNDELQTNLSNALSNQTLLEYVRTNHETEENYSIDNAVIYERMFSGKDSLKELQAVVSYSYRDQSEDQEIRVFNNTLSVKSSEDGRERSMRNEDRNNLVTQIDYAQPIFKGTVELGYKGGYRGFKSDYGYEIRNTETGEFVNQPMISNQFLYTEAVQAAYLVYSRKIGDFAFSAGSRTEYTDIRTHLYNNDLTTTQNYLDFFPSAQLTYDFSSKSTAKFTYSRRIDRPGAWRLNPFPDVTDSLNIRLGNPDLKPEYIHSFELGQLLTYSKSSLVYNIFYRKIEGAYDFIAYLDNGITYRQPRNLNTVQTYGLEVIHTAKIANWWDINASISVFRSIVDGENIAAGYTNTGYGWNTKLTTDFDLPWDIDMQITGNYTSPEVEAQGKDLARYYADISLQRKFFKGRATASIIGRDVFNTRNFSGINETSEFRQEFTYKRKSQMLLLSLAYQF